MADLVSIEERLEMIKAEEERRRRDGERDHHPGDARSSGDLFDDVLTAMANHLAGYNRERHEDANRAQEREEILKEIRERAEKYLKEAPSMKELAQRSREVDKAVECMGKHLPPSEREELHKQIERVQQKAEHRALELQEKERPPQQREISQQRER